MSDRMRFRATAQETIEAGALVTGIVDPETGVILVRNARQMDHINTPLTLDPDLQWEGFNEAIARHVDYPKGVDSPG